MLARTLGLNLPKLISACCGTLNVLDDGPVNSKGCHPPDSAVDRLAAPQPQRLPTVLSQQSLNTARRQLVLLEDALTCPVEQEIATQVTRLSCGHAFSQSVTDTLARQSSPCPCCRNVVLHEQLDAAAEQAARVLREAFPEGVDCAPDAAVAEFAPSMPPLKDYMFVAPPPPDPAENALALQYYVNIICPMVSRSLQGHNGGNPLFNIADFRIRSTAKKVPLTRYAACFADDTFRRSLVQQATDALNTVGQPVSLSLYPTRFSGANRVLNGSGFRLYARLPIEQIEDQALAYYLDKLVPRLLPKVTNRQPMKRARKSGVCIRMQYEASYSTLTRYIHLFAHRPNFRPRLAANLGQALSEACGAPVRIHLVENTLAAPRANLAVVRCDITYQVLGRTCPLSAAQAV
jgi:hypothetical protein